MNKLMFILIALALFCADQVIAQPPDPSAPADKLNNPTPPSCPPPPGMGPNSPPSRFNAIERFKSADTNGDGYLTLEEFLALPRPSPHPSMAGRSLPPHKGVRQGRDQDYPMGESQMQRGQGPNRQKPPIPPNEGRHLKAEEIFKKADINNDGKLSLEEFKDHIPKHGPKPQGSIPSESPRQGPPPERGPLGKEILQKADTNKDGKVTFEELKAVRPHITEERFKWLDADGDGTITENDIIQKRQEIRLRFKEADVNNDGKLSREEAKNAFPNLTDERFSRRDANNDGFLTPDELRPGRNKK